MELKLYLSELFKGKEATKGNVETTFGVIRLIPSIELGEEKVKRSYRLVKIQRWSEVLQEKLNEYYNILNERNKI